MTTKISYRQLVFLCTLFSGATGLIFQVVWQKYLSFLVGSEARSISLVVAIFLFGLAVGYQFWGKFTEKGLNRYQLVKTYGYVELFIGVYAILFPRYFPIIKSLAYTLPNSVFVDMLITLLLLFLPTFFMGATIPMLTKAVPETLAEVNECHAKIYGINTLGAFFGTFLAGFFLIEKFGLANTLLLGGCVNIFIAFAFFLNPYKGEVQKQTEFSKIPNSFSAIDLYLYVFIMGTVSICFEVLFVRILSLTIGSSHYVFPVVLGIFVLGLALGSLSIKGKKLSVDYLFRQLKNAVLLSLIIYLTVPFWPYWTSTIKVSLVSLPSNFYVFLFLMILFTAMFLIPFLIFMGRLLPLGYALADKGQKNYGKICGTIYFFNTVGTVFGAIVFGYLLLHYFNIDKIYKINIALILTVFAYFLFKEKRKRSALVVTAALLALVILPAWNRNSHALGLFRTNKPAPYHFKGIFQVPAYKDLYFPFFEDGANTTVSVLADKTEEHKSIVVNGKSDSNTAGDYPTVTLLATAPYFFAPDHQNLKASVIGLGTGITAGALGLARDIKTIDVLEISRSVIKASPHFDPFTYGLRHNPKVKIHEIDAFKYFTKLKDPVDLIISEPSNPWVVGVENLFTLEFYKLAKQSLTPEGVFFQWIQLYEIDENIFYAIIDNIMKVFDHVKIIQIGTADVGVLASSKNPLEQPLAKRFFQPEILKVHQKMGLGHPKYFELVTAYETEQLRWFQYKNVMGTHDIETPKIGYKAAKHQFLGTDIHLHRLMASSGAPRWLRGSQKKFLHKKDLISSIKKDSGLCQNKTKENKFFCTAFKEMTEHLEHVEHPLHFQKSLNAYSLMRDMGLYPQDLAFLARVQEHFLKPTMFGEFKDKKSAIQALAKEYTLEQKLDLTKTLIAMAFQQNLFSEKEARNLEDSFAHLAKELKIQIEAYQKIQEERDLKTALPSEVDVFSVFPKNLSQRYRDLANGHMALHGF